ncbi:MAG: protein-L-isoaspartate(D-aspartate) O-methyltransferase [Gammaproteobacteria bacterium]
MQASTRLIEEIRADFADTADLTGLPALSDAVAGALRRVPRDAFVPERYRDQAWENHPLPIGHDQTISQPYIVALMTQILEPGKSDRVLEVGTGSGYQAAVLAELVAHVYTIEIVAPLADRARQTLQALGYVNVTVRAGDGYRGLPEHAPFDAIIVTAGAREVPPPLVGQLKAGGRMIIPTGDTFLGQELILVQKAADGTVTRRRILPVRFVPLTREKAGGGKDRPAGD